MELNGKDNAVFMESTDKIFFGAPDTGLVSGIQVLGVQIPTV